MKNTAIYARNSSQMQTADELVNSQIRQLFNYASKNNIKITEVITEFDRGIRTRRINQGKLQAKIRRGEIQGLLITSWDRISRDEKEIDYWKALCKKNGIKVFTL